MSSGTAVRPLRPPRSQDREPLRALLSATGVFRPAEIEVALEVFDAACRAPQGDYHSLCAEQNGRLAGWICWGATPCTEGTFDLYWIAVDPALHGRGLGSALLRAFEQRLPASARLIRIETSGRPDYDRTAAFYQSHGYRIAAVLPELYGPGDAQVIYLKRPRA